MLKKIVSLTLALCMLLTVALIAGCNQEQQEEAAKTYTYKGYTTAFGTNWNPHTWETNADDSVNSYITSPFCTMSILDSENGVYQWVYEMATKITDVTAANKGDLTKYGVTLPEGQTVENTESGFVFEIALNPNAKWENGTPITADDYIYSMEQLLNSKMRNYRSNLYWQGESAVAGGLAFYNSESPIYAPVVPAYEEEGFTEEAAIAKIGGVDDVFVQIIADIPLTKLAKERFKPKRRFKAWEIVLLVLGSPIWFSLIISAFAVVISIYVSLWAIVVSVWSVFLALAVCAPVGIILTIVYAVMGDGYVAVITLATSLVCFGCSVFLFFACKSTAKGGLRLTKKLLLGIKKLFVKKGDDYEE